MVFGQVLQYPYYRVEGQLTQGKLRGNPVNKVQKLCSFGALHVIRVYENRMRDFEWLQGVWPKIILVAMEMPIFYVNLTSLNYPNRKDESVGPYG